jgi:5S rRNA maturation endonuclease (ribonuclease M5)
VRNVPLAESDNEKVRELVGLEAKLVTDAEAMNPIASKWWRVRPYLTPEICTRWGIGVMPLDGGGDKRGWSLRGKVVYRFLSEDDKVLCYVGRDPEYERKQREFEALKPECRDPKKVPAKYHFPKNAFFRGQELYGQHASRLNARPEYRDFLAEYGLIIVEGFNDTVALDHHGVYSEAICSNQLAEQQIPKVVERARRLARGRISLLFDVNEAGDRGAKEAAWKLLEAGLDVRLGWSQDMLARKYRGMEPEHLERSSLDGAILPRLRR